MSISKPSIDTLTENVNTDFEKQMENEKEARVLEATKRVFLRYGYRRVTMQDIADEAGISRPALYLIFPNKDEAFLAAIRDFTAGSMKIIQEGVAQQATIEAKLQFAFEIWSVKPFELMLASPDAKDLVECSHGFAKATFDQIYAGFEAVIAEILALHVGHFRRSSARGSQLTEAQIAHLIVAATHGFKESAKDIAELRSMIAGLIALTLAAVR
jgi:AcrR family transcriptional regulator